MLPTTDELVYGLDFGTSNTSLAVAGRGQEPRLLPIDPIGDPKTVLPTQVFFGRAVAGAPYVSCGVQAFKDLIARGVKGDGRFLFELKAVMGFPVRSTRILGRVYEIPELVAHVIRFVKEQGDRAVGANVKRVVCGRPVRFTDDEESDARAQATLARALELAGFGEHAFELEPIAADVASAREANGVTLTVDAGGGTLDISVVRRADSKAEVLGVSGRPEAGRNVDRRLVYEKLLGPFGRDVTWARGGKVPEWVFAKIGAWSELHLLSQSDDLKRALARADTDSRGHPSVKALQRYFSECHGYAFLREVESAKIELSSKEEASVMFAEGGVEVAEMIRRGDLEPVLEPLIVALDRSIDEALKQAKLSEKDVTAVERIGGSSRIPAIGERLAKRFGAAKVRGTGSLTAVAMGLAETAKRKWLA